MTKFRFGTGSLAQLEKINPILKTLAFGALSISTVDFGILKLGGIRTAEEQYELYKVGNSKADGTKKLSYHQSGMAVDFIPYIDCQYTWSSKEAFKAINAAVNATWKEMCIPNYSLVWGGNWKIFVDMPHYELRRKI